MRIKTFAAGLAVIAGLLGVSAHAMGPSQPVLPLDTVAHVDLTRYAGEWYEIARLPQFFEKGCIGVTARYEIKPNGDLDVVNRCRQGTLDGKLKTAHGTGKVVDVKSQAKLKVTFFWPFYGDYWVLELGSNYEYSVVGSPDRKSFWILSRTPTLPAETSADIIQRFSEKKFNLSELYFTPQ